MKTAVKKTTRKNSVTDLNQPLVVIVTPSFNQAKFIGKTIDSVLAQDYPNLNYWVIDGGSTDGTKKILKSYRKLINWVSEPDKGQTDAINKGFKLALAAVPTELKRSKSKIILAYLNSDDYYLPNAIAKAVTALTASPSYSWVVGDAVIVDEEGRTIQQMVRLYKFIWRQLLSWPLMLILNPVPQPATFFRYSAFAKLGGFRKQLKFTMDYEFWLRLWQQVGPPVILHTPLAAFRIHGQSKGGTQYLKQFAEQYQVAQGFTNQSWILKLHGWHNQAIQTIYGYIK